MKGLSQVWGILKSRNIFHKASPLGKFFECLCVGVQGKNWKTLSEKNSEGDPKKLASKFWTSIKFSLSIFWLKKITCNKKKTEKYIFSSSAKNLQGRNIFHKASPLGKFFECLWEGIRGKNSKMLSEKEL